MERARGLEALLASAWRVRSTSRVRASAGSRGCAAHSRSVCSKGHLNLGELGLECGPTDDESSRSTSAIVSWRARRGARRDGAGGTPRPPRGKASTLACLWSRSRASAWCRMDWSSRGDRVVVANRGALEGVREGRDGGRGQVRGTTGHELVQGGAEEVGRVGARPDALDLRTRELGGHVRGRARPGRRRSRGRRATRARPSSRTRAPNRARRPRRTRPASRSRA